MRTTRILAAFMVFVLLGAAPLAALDLGSLDSALQNNGIQGGAGGAESFAAIGEQLQNSFQGIFQILQRIFSQLIEAFKEIFGGPSGGNSGANPGGDAGATPGSDGGATPGTDAGATPGSDGGATPGTDAGSTDTSLPPADDSFKGSFQKNNVISDREMTDYQSMTQQEIQAFLEKKGSVLARPVNGIKPSAAIFQAAQKYKINPKLLLTRAQVEKGLISKKTASQSTLDWAFGCGAYESGNWNQAYKGFDKQVDGAAKTFRRWYDDGQKRGGQIGLRIDGQSITTKNAATYSLYKYTPHFQGAKLHWDVHRGYWGR